MYIRSYIHTYIYIYIYIYTYQTVKRIETNQPPLLIQEPLSEIGACLTIRCAWSTHVKNKHVKQSGVEAC